MEKVLIKLNSSKSRVYRLVLENPVLRPGKFQGPFTLSPREGIRKAFQQDVANGFITVRDPSAEEVTPAKLVEVKEPIGAPEVSEPVEPAEAAETPEAVESPEEPEAPEAVEVVATSEVSEPVESAEPPEKPANKTRRRRTKKKTTTKKKDSSTED
jgi:hypothetical protein